MTSRIMTGLLKCSRIKLLTACGTCIRVRTLENAVEAARIKRIGVNVRIASTKSAGYPGISWSGRGTG